MITLENVSKRYKVRDGHKIILEDANVVLPAQNIALLGANGAGKSTVLRMISGAERPDEGRIICNRRVSFPLGFSGSFNGSMTGIENALFTARIYGEETEAVINYVKEFSELGEHLYMPVQTYSSGMRARLAFGISLAINFELYLVDEITAVGDARFRDRSREAFRGKLGNANLLMVSHNISSLRDYCDVGAVIEGGEIVFYDDLEAAIAHHEGVMRPEGNIDGDVGDDDRRGRAAQGRRRRREIQAQKGRATGPQKAKPSLRALERRSQEDLQAPLRVPGGVRLPRPGSSGEQPGQTAAARRSREARADETPITPTRPTSEHDSLPPPLPGDRRRPV